MSGDDLESIVASLRDGVESRSGRGERSVTRSGLVVSCSMSDCSHDPLWPVNAGQHTVGVRTLGNQTWDRHGDRTVLDGSIEHLETNHDIESVLVVGHTECQVIENAYDRWASEGAELPKGIEARLEPLCSLVGDAFDREFLTRSMDPRTIRHRLVEYNVRRQIVFLRRTLSSSATVAGYVHDQKGAYGSFPDKRYLVAVDGETKPTTIEDRLPEDASARVASLLQ